jgi:hypothetical protein
MLTYFEKVNDLQSQQNLQRLQGLDPNSQASIIKQPQHLETLLVDIFKKENRKSEVTSTIEYQSEMKE